MMRSMCPQASQATRCTLRYTQIYSVFFPWVFLHLAQVVEPGHEVHLKQLLTFSAWSCWTFGEKILQMKEWLEWLEWSDNDQTKWSVYLRVTVFAVASKMHCWISGWVNASILRPRDEIHCAESTFIEIWRYATSSICMKLSGSLLRNRHEMVSTI